MSELITGLTLDIDGASLPFDKFRKAQDQLAKLLQEVDRGLSETKHPRVNWVVSSVSSGSVHLTVKGMPADDVEPSDIAQVVTAVSTGISTIEDRPERPPFFSDRALESAKALANLVGKDIGIIQLGFDSYKVSLTKHLVAHVDDLIQARYKSFGTMEGILNAINLHKKPLFRIYDLLTDRGVKCYFSNELLETIKDALGKRVMVYGLISSTESGEKVSINVEEIEVFPAEEELSTLDDIIGILGGEY